MIGKTQEPFKAEIDSILNLMTLEEKIGQLTLYTSGWDVTGPVLRENYLDDLRQGKVGNLFNAHTAAYNHNLQKIAVEETRLGIPLLFGYDVIHGYKTIFPISLAESASWDMDAIERSARIAAIEAAAGGLHWTFAPMVDIARDPRWGRVMEGAGEDTYLGSCIAKARVKGFQGSDLASNNTILACAKHFAAYGAAQAGRDYHTVDISENTLRDIYLPPFKAALDAGVATFMTSFNEYNGMPATGSKFLLQDVLRDDWKFDGFVVTDYTSINEMIPHGVAANLKHAANLAIQAGVDMDMQGAAYADYLEELVNENSVSISQIEGAVRQILKAKYQLGLFDDPYRYGDTLLEKNLILSNGHLDAARDMAKKSIVLLKNDNQTLPLKTSLRKIALIGPLANNQDNLLGAWAASGRASDCVSLLSGIQEVLNESQILFHPGCRINGEETDFSEAVSIASQADAIIVALGEERHMSGEAASRSSIGLPGSQLELVKTLSALDKPIIVVLMNGRPLAIPWLDQRVDAILETWFLGNMAGPAITDVLFGKYNPSGKLPITFPRNEGQIPIYYNMKNTGRPFNATDNYTSKYLDVANEPLYPFGFGLSYTSFRIENINIFDSVLTIYDDLVLTADLKNNGTVSGEEVVQLYITDKVGSLTRPVRELKGFKKIFLEPGQSEQIRFEIPIRSLGFHNAKMDYVVEEGAFDIHLGNSSTNTVTKSIIVQ